MVPTCELTNSTTVTVTNGGVTNGEARVRWYLMEFASGTSVQRGTFNMGAGNATRNVTLPTAVDLSKSFVNVYARTTDTDESSDERRLLRAEPTSTTNVQFTRGETGIALDVVWQVVEHTAPGFTLPIVTFNLTGGGAFEVDAGYFRPEITTATNLSFTRPSTNRVCRVDWYTIE